MTTEECGASHAAVPARFDPCVSIIINNFNYGRFLRSAIDSAIMQIYAHTEVIVVDDGSTDDSRYIISSYGSKITPVFKPNGGQASALNAGFAVCRGDIVIFLDADDILYPEAVANVVPLMQATSVSKVHWPLWVMDAGGEITSETRPPQVPPEGDFRQQVLERGPSNVASSPTSGNAWSRSFLQKILPIPDNLAYYRFCADEYLYTLAPVFGRVRTIAEPQGCYRIHGSSVYSSRSFREKLDMELSGYEQQCEALSSTLARNKIFVDGKSWKQHSWFHLLDRAISDVLMSVPKGDAFVLIDGNTWGIATEFELRKVQSFGCDGANDLGPPADDSRALEWLRSLLEDNVSFLVLSWSCFWWLEEYINLFRRLDQVSRRIVSNDAVIIFDLRRQTAAFDKSTKPNAATILNTAVTTGLQDHV